jgi:Tol biopolymer transport system component
VDPGWRACFESVAISPDGGQLAAGILTRDGAEVWIRELPDGPQSRLTTEGPINYRPTWMPDGKRLAFRTLNPATGAFQLVAKRADGIGPTDLLVRESRSVASAVLSRDGAWTVYRTDATEGGRGDILGLRAGDSVAIPLVATPAQERYPTLSPNGRWLAYRSGEGGTDDIWVRPFPNVGGGKFQVSVNGGTEPVWSRSGRELFYITPGNELVAASVPVGPPFAVTRRQVLFTLPAGVNRNIATAAYDVSPDDSRFLMVRSPTANIVGIVASSTGERLILVERWIEELKARVPR